MFNSVNYARNYLKAKERCGTVNKAVQNIWRHILYITMLKNQSYNTAVV